MGTEAPWIWIDGKIIPAQEATVGVLDHSFLYGDSIYETVRTYGGTLFRLDAHLDRLDLSAARVGMTLPADRATVRAIVTQVAAHGAPGEVGVRLMISRGEGPLGIDPSLCPTPRILAFGWNLPAGPNPLEAQGIDLTIADTRRNPASALDSAIKSGNFLNNIQAYREAKARGVSDAVLLTVAGHVAEGTTWNLFWVRDGEVRTGEDRGILLGVTRAAVFEALEQLSIPVTCDAFLPEDLLSADEAFLTSSIRGVIPISSIDLARYPVPGPITERVREEYAKITERERA